MARSLAVFVTGAKEELSRIRGISNKIEVASVRATNRVASLARTEAARRIMSEVSFPRGYLDPQQKRLYVGQQARKGDVTARIVARGRPTSLARFVLGNPAFGKMGVNLRVGQGIKTSERLFLVKLRSGGATTETKFNAGLAIRLRPGESINNKTKAIRMKNGLVLLYGPSVQQAFMAESGNGVAAEIAKKIPDMWAAEFDRLLKLR